MSIKNVKVTLQFDDGKEVVSNVKDVVFIGVGENGQCIRLLQGKGDFFTNCIGTILEETFIEPRMRAGRTRPQVLEVLKYFMGIMIDCAIGECEKRIKAEGDKK